MYHIHTIITSGWMIILSWFCIYGLLIKSEVHVRCCSQLILPALQLRSIHRSVPTDALHTLVHAFNLSHVDYCNAVLYRATDSVIQRLQAVLHATARLITGVQRNNHITRHCATHFTSCPCLSTLRSKLCWWHMNVSMADHHHQCTSATSVHRSSPFPFSLSFALLTTMTWLYHILEQCIMVCAVSRHGTPSQEQ